METFDCERNPFAPDAQKRTKGGKDLQKQGIQLVQKPVQTVYNFCAEPKKIIITVNCAFSSKVNKTHFCKKISLQKSYKKITGPSSSCNGEGRAGKNQ